MSDSESVFEASVKEFSDWCNQNFLELNVGKTYLILSYPLVESLLGASGHLISREEDSAAVAEMKRIMAADLKERYSEQKELLHRTTALDPRFKSFPYMSASQRDEIFRQLIEATVSLHQTQSEVKQEPGHGTDVKEEPGVPTLPDLPAVADTIHVEDVEEIGAEAPETQTQTTCLLDSLLTDVFITYEEPPKGPYQLCSTEVASYRQEAELSMKENPLEWWEVNAFRYPMLTRMAKVICPLLQLACHPRGCSPLLVTLSLPRELA